MSRQDAENLLKRGASARLIGELDTALNLYQESLKIWMELYKNETNTALKADILKLLEIKMSEAEDIKKEITERDDLIKRAAEQRQSQGVFSVFGSTNKQQNTSAGVNQKKDPVPDFYDYSIDRKKSDNVKAKKGVSPVNVSTNNNNSKTIRSPSPRSTSNGKATGINNNNNTSGKESNIKLTNEQSKLNEYEKQIMEEMLDSTPGIKWEDIAGLAFAKQTLQEAVILPNLRPDLFTGLRKPPKGVLLFGPPGTGKTLLAKAVATESGFCFFSITSSSVTSKYLGEGEKLMKALFELARAKQPSVIFFDEIDALMSARKENEHEASRRLKTEFMTQVDGASTNNDDRILIMAATNIPWEIDEAVLRRLAKRIYVPLPDIEARKALISHLLSKQGAGGSQIVGKKLDKIVTLTEGYSGSDLSAVCHEAALGPIRELGPAALKTVKAEDVRHLNEQDFINAIKNIRPSVSKDSLEAFTKWAEQYGVSR